MGNTSFFQMVTANYGVFAVMVGYGQKSVTALSAVFAVT